MPSHLIDYRLFGDQFSTPEMRAVFDEEATVALVLRKVLAGGIASEVIVAELVASMPVTLCFSTICFGMAVNAA